MPHNAYMKSSYDTSVVTPVDELWAQLVDIDRLVTVLPDVGLARDGDALTGSLKCRLGSHQVTYRFVARATLAAGASKAAAIEISGSEARGDGTFEAVLTVAANEVGDQTRVELGGDIEATGRGEGADARAWARVMETYLTAVLPEGALLPSGSSVAERPAERLSAQVAEPAPGSSEPAEGTTTTGTHRSAGSPVAVPAATPAEPVDEVGAPGPSVPTGPIALAVATLVILVVATRRRRGRRR
jgi:carbon monoxide dehydrogenase subunit G